MGTLKWYARDPRAALTGMMELTLEERGAYTTILDLIYAHDGELEDNNAVLPWLRVKAQTWRRLRAQLLSKGKLYVRDGCLRNERADEEVRKALTKWMIATKAADQRWATHREIKELQDARAMLPTPTLRKSSAKIMPIALHKTPEKKK